ncbi:MAG: hypothetical protein ACFFE3_04315 [Candidatus Thorarchaeota archaeon]
MRILVISSCSKRKLHSSPKQPKCHNSLSYRKIAKWRQRFSDLCVPARDMYIGPQNTEIVKAVDLLRTIPEIEIQLFIVSAGFGVLDEYDLVPPYDCSFTRMKMAEIRKRAEDLELRSSFLRLIDNNIDLVYFALGKQYHSALEKNILKDIQTPSIVFHKGRAEHLIRIPCAADTVKAFSNHGHKIHGVVGFKGDLLRILARHAIDHSHPYTVVKNWTKSYYIRDLIRHLSGLDISGI